LVDEWVTAIGLRKEEYGTHSLRRTKASLIYKATGNLRAVQIPFGHTKIENTVRYLGVDVEDALELAEHTPHRSRTSGHRASAVSGSISGTGRSAAT
jgi:site-specific recombinase XerC